jgi:hypothetical protein
MARLLAKVRSQVLVPPDAKLLPNIEATCRSVCNCCTSAFSSGCIVRSLVSVCTAAHVFSERCALRYTAHCIRTSRVVATKGRTIMESSASLSRSPSHSSVRCLVIVINRSTTRDQAQYIPMVEAFDAYSK